MKHLGLIDRVPRLLGIQAEGARPIVDAFYSGEDLKPVASHTIADSIAVGTPRNWRRALRQIRESHGEMLAVSDEEILHAMRITARLAGVFGEPAGIAGIAGVQKALREGIVQSHETVLVVITGNGLKDIQSAKQAAGAPLEIEPTIDALAKALAESIRPSSR
jgi:threonine synthase